MTTDTESLALGRPAAPTRASRSSRLSIGLLGMVIFIGSEIMLFGSFFTSYFLVRFNIAHRWPPLDAAGKPFELPKVITGVNTAILISSSFTLWWAERCLFRGDRKGFLRGMIVTIMMGATFLIIQLNEYAHLGFTPQDKAFGSVFYGLTGLHGAHVFIGLNILTFLFIRGRRGDFTKQSHGPLAAGSVYWHFVDVVWILLYLIVYISS